jgi:hypothetical protein
MSAGKKPNPFAEQFQEQISEEEFPEEQFLEQNVEQRRHGQAVGTQGHQVSPAHAEPVVRRLDAVTPRPTRWLWPGRVALGQVTLVAGEPGAGSSLLLMDLASRVTRGRALPGSALPPTIPHDAAKAESVVAKAEGATRWSFGSTSAARGCRT